MINPVSDEVTHVKCSSVNYYSYRAMIRQSPVFHHQTEENIFVVGDGVNDGRFGEFLVKEGRWRERAPLAVGRRRHAAAVVKVPTAAVDGEETLIGVFGGSKCGVLVSPMSYCEVYEVRQDRFLASSPNSSVCPNSWHKLPDLPEARVRPAAACLPGDSRAFVFGGWNHHDSQVLNSSCMTVRGWDTRRTTLASVVFCHLQADWRRRRQEATSADFWQSAARMRTERWGHAAAAFRGAILVAGGVAQNDRILKTVEMFTPPDARNPRGQWTELTDMQKPRSQLTILSSANAVFALGGNATHH
ncbi:Kelch-like protein 18 [Sparganum proliferum]